MIFVIDQKIQFQYLDLNFCEYLRLKTYASVMRDRKK